MSEEPKALYRLMAWLSPAYPVGAFSYSSGIEWAVEAGDIADAASFRRWLDVVIESGSAFCDAVLFAHAHRAAAADDAKALTAVADVIRRNLPDGYREGMQYGMIGWYVPLETFPDTYNGQPLGLAALASQKHYMSLYLNNVYGDPELEAWFRDRYKAAGKKLDMGKSCVRFRQLDDLALNVIGEAIARSDLDDYLARYLQARGSSRATRRTADR